MWPLFVMWNAGLVNVVLPTITVATLFIVAVSLIKYITADTHIPIRDATKQHNWHSVKCLTETRFDGHMVLGVTLAIDLNIGDGEIGTCYCSVCESLMTTGEGLYCDCCGVCADRGCIRAADRKFRCKVISCSDKGRWKHHWVKGKWIVSSGHHQVICLWGSRVKSARKSVARNMDLPTTSAAGVNMLCTSCANKN
uniref:Uncharacterized protein n=1 Tax=Timema monikensis TaxID=170555 RepID=A0A7R9E5D3_9NEOP|nr:unnamed protein product [Timema monikensis]